MDPRLTVRPLAARDRSAWDQLWAIDPDHRGAGVGRARIEALELRARELGCGTLYWVTEGDSEVARRLHDRIGTLSSYVRYEIDLRPPAGPEGS